MKIPNIRSSAWHKYDDDVAYSKPGYFKKGFWKIKDRKKFIKRYIKSNDE